MSSSRSRSLSGGERARLALAILALEGVNFLLLDEPTNHLDIPAQEALQEVLENFSGTILLVSHDRYLIDRLATQIWDLRDGKLTLFKGAYREYMMQRAAVAGRPAEKPVALLRKPVFKVDGKEARQRAEHLARLESRIQEQEETVRRLNSRAAAGWPTAEFRAHAAPQPADRQRASRARRPDERLGAPGRGVIFIGGVP